MTAPATSGYGDAHRRFSDSIRAQQRDVERMVNAHRQIAEAIAELAIILFG